MARKVKPYNHSYKIANRFLKKHPKAELAVVYMYTIANLNPKCNFSKEGTRRAWNDFKKQQDKLSQYNEWTQWTSGAAYQWPHPLAKKWRDDIDSWTTEYFIKCYNNYKAKGPKK